MSFPFGPTVSQRGSLKSVAKMSILNPAGTVGRKPFGGFVSSGGFPADFVAKGAGNCGFFPCVTCPNKIPGAAHKIPNATMRKPHRPPVASIKSPQRSKRITTKIPLLSYHLLVAFHHYDVATSLSVLLANRARLVSDDDPPLR